MSFSINQLQGGRLIRNKQDFYPTPAYATLKLLEKEVFTGNIWEPACGNGAISKFLINNAVYSTDLFNFGYGITGQDFLTCGKPADKIDNIVTNPPYKLAEKFVISANEIAEQKVAFLLKLNFLEGQYRYKLFQQYRPARVHVFSKRINFDRGEEKTKGTGLLAYSWFVWDKMKAGGRTEIDWLL
jgi:hypothetical protein